MAVPGPSVSRPRHRLGRYQITGRLGRGGMGQVYRAYDESLDREVAVKTLSGEGPLDPESLQRFEIEARAAARLQHPNILTVYELGEDRGLKFIAMELLGGVDLETALRAEDPLLLEEKLEVAVQVCRGLAYAHQHGIVHRDMKPSNVRVLDDGTAKIMDFGIAKLAGTNVTKSGMMVGTVHYMSPEQIRGVELDGRSDVFSMGVILHELLSGKRPFPGDEPTAVLYKIVHAEPEPLEGDLGPVGPRLREVLQRALAKEPAQRTPGADRLADELQSVLAELQAARTHPVRSDDAALHAARRLVREGRPEEAVTRLRAALEAQPGSLELRRAVRAAGREALRLRRASASELDEYPELDATFQAPSTQLSPGPETEAAARPSSQPVPRPVSPRGWLVPLALGLAALGLAGLAGWLALRGPAAVTRLEVRSQPRGARVLLDGRDTGVVTDGQVPLPGGARQVTVTLVLPGFRQASRTLRLPEEARAALSLALEPAPATARVRVTSTPPGATVRLDGGAPLGRTPLDVAYAPDAPHRVELSLEGFRPQELALQAGSNPPELQAELEDSGPRGFLSVNAPYPVDLAFRGRTLVQGQAQFRISLPAGQQTVTLSSARLFLHRTASVAVPPDGTVTLSAPAAGRLNIRASPDNCQVFVNGSFVDYPPILDRPAAAGRVTVTFKWPDGARTDEQVDLAAGGVAYVMGRR